MPWKITVYTKEAEMNEYVIGQKLARLEKQVVEVSILLKTIEDRFSKGEMLWDNADLTRNWKVSQRTLADWRSKKLIGYSQINGKIFYSADDRRVFLSGNHVNCIENE
jgi:hypothetical protein